MHSEESASHEYGGKRWFYLVNALAGFLFLSLVYAWSVFVRPLESEFGWTRSQTSLTFSICMAVFCVGGLTSGRILKKMSPKAAILLSAASIMTGFLLTSRVNSLWELYIFYGAMCGFGVGLGYNTLMDVTMRWFPGQQGMVSGVLLMGFGMGGSLLGTVAFTLTEAMGWRKTFAVLGIALAGLLTIIAMNVKKPQSNQTNQLNQANQTSANKPDLSVKKAALEQNLEPDGFTTRDMLLDRSFQVYYLRTMLVSAIGLALLGNAAPFVYSIAQNQVTAAHVAGLVSIFSGIGRLVGGIVFDKIGSRRALWIGALGETAAVGVLMYAAVVVSLPVLTVGYMMGGFFYGANVPCNSSFLHRIYGQENFAVNLSVLNSMTLLSSFLGPYMTGVLFTFTDSYVAPCVMLIAVGAGALAATALLKRHYVPARPGEIL